MSQLHCSERKEIDTSVDSECFTSFDFSQVRQTSPLDQVLQELISPYLDEYHPLEEQQGCLALLPVQTGLGKTHSTLSLIIEQMLAAISNPDSIQRTIIYITDSIDNTRNAYKALLKQIDEQKTNNRPRFNEKQQTLLKSRILYVPSQANQLADCPHEVVTQLLDTFAQGNQALHRRWRSYQRMAMADFGKNDLVDELRTHQLNTAQEIYTILLREIRQSLRERQRNDLILVNAVEQEWLDQFLPVERFRRGEAHVLFMTTSKYIHGCDHALGKYLPMLDLKGQLLLIDEIDRQNGEMLKLMVRQEAIDLVAVVRTLHANLRIQRLDNDPIYRNIAPMFEKLAIELEEFAKDWHIECAFDVDKIDLIQTPLSLFSDRTYTHVHSFRHCLNRLYHDENRQKNLIDVIEYTGGEFFGPNENVFSRFVNRADQLYQNFVNIVRLAVFIRLENARKTGREERDERSLSSLTQQVVSSILHHYNLAELIEPVLAAFNARSLRSLQQKQPHTQRSYHGRGFKFIEVKRNRDSHDTIASQFNGLLRSPSGMLAEMVESGAVIVGISATAEIQTVVHNFDIHYLKQRLGNAFHRLSGNQRQRLHDYYLQRRNYADQVTIDVNFYRADDYWLEQQFLLWRPVRNPRAELNRLLLSENGGNHARGQLSKLLQAMQRFVTADFNRYMLVLRNGFFRSEQNELLEFIDNCIQQWAQKKNISVQLFHNINAAALRTDIYSDVLKKLQTSMDKVIVFTSYSTMGVGKNPDYPVGLEKDRESLVWVGYGTEQTSFSDIDSLYLEKPTYLLPGNEEDGLSNRLTQFHNVMVLQGNNELTIREARNWIGLIMHGTKNEQLLTHYHKTTDYPAALRKTIEQAVGRTARTAYKRRCILLLADAGLESHLAEDDRDERLFSHEYLALRDHAKCKEKGARPDLQQRRCYNLAQRHTENSRYYIQELLKRLRHPKERDIHDWEILRQLTLKAPSINEEPHEFNWLYVKHLHGDGYAYRYQGDPESSAADLLFFDRASNGNEVSADAASLPLLMQNTQVYRYFQANGFATEWESGSWFLNPLVFQSIYLGALGEQAARAVLEFYGVFWQDMPSAYYERFDALVNYQGTQALLDVKHWRSPKEYSSQVAMTTKIRELRAAMGVSKVIYLRLLGPSDQMIRYMDEEFHSCLDTKACVIEIPALLDERDGQVVGSNLIKLLEWIGS